AAGCTVVIKPAELTPLTTLTLARIASEAGLPAGVFNVLTGAGADAGTALAGHPGVDVVTFTGSTGVGRKVMAAAAVHGHRTQLELGGKAPFVVFGDADLDAAIQGAVAGAARHLEGKATAEYSADHTSSIRREAVGVVGSITPWNYPLQMAVWKVLPALAAGCTVVIKPAELTPLTTLTLARLATEAGLPDGVFNVVTGAGADAGTALAGHADVDVVTFTGSTGVGRKVMAAAAVHGHRTQLELGGKAPFVVFDDADLDAAIQGAVAGALINSGQDCTAATRAIVARDLYDDFVAGVAEVMSKMVVGDPADPDTDLGPLISLAHRDKVAAMVARAPDQGARIVTGGTAPDLPGAFYRPTLIADVDESSEVYRDEIFGPVLTVRTFTDDDDALRQANDTVYGLAASAWTRDVYRAQRASREIHAGCVWINDHIPIISEMPHGGVGASGFGKDMSDYSFEEYLAIKHVMSDITGVADKAWHRTIFTKR
ncbi:MAG: aldehyde dehydrogenase family protein, partial [Mycobacterium sp.]